MLDNEGSEKGKCMVDNWNRNRKEEKSIYENAVKECGRKNKKNWLQVVEHKR